MKRLFTITTILLSPALMADTGFSVELGGVYQEKTSVEFNLPTSYGEGIENHENSTPINGTNFNTNRAHPFLAISYNIPNTRIKLVGQYSYHNSQEGQYYSKDTTGYYWKLEGGESPHNNYVANNILATSETQTTIMGETKLYIESENYIVGRAKFSSRVGLTYNHDYKDYEYLVSGTMYGAYLVPYTQHGIQKLTTNYVAPFFGFNADVMVAKNLNFFIDVEAYAMNANTKLKATQELNYSLYDDEVVKQEKNQTSGRYKLEGGFKILFGKPYLKVFAGIDSWGYVAEAESPSQSGCEPIKIHGRTDTKAYVGTSLHLPIN
jgi:hypothetical protein